MGIPRPVTNPRRPTGATMAGGERRAASSPGWSETKLRHTQVRINAQNRNRLHAHAP